jgi:excisionase family DNA binding protein
MRTVDIRTVATTLKVSLPTAYGLVRRGTLSSVRIGRLWRVPEESLARFLRGEQGPRVTPETEKEAA